MVIGFRTWLVSDSDVCEMFGFGSNLDWDFGILVELANGCLQIKDLMVRGGKTFYFVVLRVLCMKTQLDLVDRILFLVTLNLCFLLVVVSYLCIMETGI